ncbi:hypothetical protein L208DRAFT_1423351 [Tricholoma matsutake]|nr:hypothetical protein L208DRAFT_1423351 [Tricholoma matsutake 945]
MADQNKDQDEENPDKKPLGSEKFYKESSSGAVILQVENILYKVSRDRLCELSDVFNDMFSLPQANLVSEGSSDENPIFLPDMTVSEFDHLLIESAYYDPPPHPIEWHIDVLKLATHWELSNHVHESAIYHLCTYNDKILPLIEKIYLARLYNIPSFIRLAFQALCDHAIKLQSLLPHNIRKLGLEVFAVLAKVKEAIEAERVLAWWDKMTREILQSSMPFSLKFPVMAKRQVELLEVPGMTKRCQDAMVDFVLVPAGLMQNKPILKQESQN